ncbi:hypothetical protein MKW98_010002 [Papaver atlanticum]|uniref:Uncharacterized protein n=1 Tax=Papaver atlanticum TaxID=357466 RepID=A0AAD4X4B4_9MAGN|nr:hypothetical protein MKW98_010002 [Papaver atlanticum]
MSRTTLSLLHLCLIHHPANTSEQVNSGELEEDGNELCEANVKHCMKKKLPEPVLREIFFETYLDHDDRVTITDQKCSYVVKAPARHPIYENLRFEGFKAPITAVLSNGQFSSCRAHVRVISLVDWGLMESISQ